MSGFGCFSFNIKRNLKVRMTAYLCSESYQADMNMCPSLCAGIRTRTTQLHKRSMPPTIPYATSY